MNEDLKQILADLKEIKEMNKKTAEILSNIATTIVKDYV